MTIRDRRGLSTLDRVGGTVVSRRTVARGVAWTAPVVAVATAAPAFAASSGTVTFTSLGIACKLPGASCQNDTGVTKGYVVRVRACSTISTGFVTDVIIRDASVSLNGATAQPFQVSVSGLSDGCPDVTTSTVPDPEAPGTQQNPQNPDVKLTFTGPGCCIIDFAIQGEPDSNNNSISGTAPFTFEVREPGPNGAVLRTGSGTVPLTAPSTPPCDKCEPPAAP